MKSKILAKPKFLKLQQERAEKEEQYKDKGSFRSIFKKDAPFAQPTVGIDVSSEEGRVSGIGID